MHFKNQKEVEAVSTSTMARSKFLTETYNAEFGWITIVKWTTDGNVRERGWCLALKQKSVSLFEIFQTVFRLTINYWELSLYALNCRQIAFSVQPVMFYASHAYCNVAFLIEYPFSNAITENFTVDFLSLFINLWISQLLPCLQALRIHLLHTDNHGFQSALS